MSKLDELIAEKVMGWRLNPHYGDKQHYPYQMYERPNMDAISTHEFQPATRLDDALLCLERATWGEGKWFLDFRDSDEESYTCDCGLGRGKAKTAALAMCLAALRASGVPEPLITQAMEA